MPRRRWPPCMHAWLLATQLTVAAGSGTDKAIAQRSSVGRRCSVTPAREAFRSTTTPGRECDTPHSDRKELAFRHLGTGAPPPPAPSKVCSPPPSSTTSTRHAGLPTRSTNFPSAEQQNRLAATVRKLYTAGALIVDGRYGLGVWLLAAPFVNATNFAPVPSAFFWSVEQLARAASRHHGNVENGRDAEASLAHLTGGAIQRPP